jgi:hypothetical protein
LPSRSSEARTGNARIEIKLNFNRDVRALFSQSLKRAGKQDACAPVGLINLII